MLNARRNFKSGVVAITGAVAILAVITPLMRQGLTFARADAPPGGSAKTAMMKDAARSVAKNVSGAGSAQGKRVVITGALLSGGHLSTAKWKGKVVVIDFWATWCPWCRVEMPSIEKLYHRYRSQGLEIVGVPLSDTAPAVRSYLNAHSKAAWPEIFDEGAGNAALAQKLGVSAFPSQCVVDRRGVLKYVIVGPSSRQLGADVRKLAADVRTLIQRADGGS